MLKLFCVVLCLTIAAHAIEVDDNSDTENFELRKCYYFGFIKADTTIPNP